MLAATPVIGAHYMIDVIAGVALAAASVLAAKRLFRIHASGNAAHIGGSSPAEEPAPRLALTRS
jgi:hypothetical protein